MSSNPSDLIKPLYAYLWENGKIRVIRGLLNQIIDIMTISIKFKKIGVCTHKRFV